MGPDGAMVTEAVRSVVERSTYSNYEIVVVADTATPVAVLDELGRIAGSRLRIVESASASTSPPSATSALPSRRVSCSCSSTTMSR